MNTNIYKLGSINLDGSQNIIMTCSDGKISTISPVLGNTDYQEYLAWLAEDNEPLPAEEATP